MAILRGTTTKFFVAAVILTIVAAALYAWSESLGGMENYKLSVNLERWAIGIFVAGLLCWIGMMVTGYGKKKA